MKMELAEIIVADARRDAQSRIEGARELAGRILQDARNEEAELRKNALEEQRLREEELQRSRLSAERQAYRLVRMRVRREILDGLFERCVRTLAGLDAETAEHFWGNLLARYGEEGDEVVLGHAESVLDEAFVRRVSDRCGKSFRLSAVRGTFLGGMILRNGACDKNLTAEMLVREFRESRENLVYEMLFAGETV